MQKDLFLLDNKFKCRKYERKKKNCRFLFKWWVQFRIRKRKRMGQFFSVSEIRNSNKEFASIREPKRRKEKNESKNRNNWHEIWQNNFFCTRRSNFTSNNNNTRYGKTKPETINTNSCHERCCCCCCW